MTDFFKGWRRKIGCTTLLMGLVFMVGWVRSLNHEDTATLDFGESQAGETHMRLDSQDREVQMRESTSVTVKSIGWNIICYRSTDWGNGSNKRPILRWHSNSIPFGTTEEFTSDLEWPNEGRWQFCGLDFGFVKGRITVNYGWTSVVYKIPYGYFVLPLTLISYWLLLSKPRKSTPKTIVPAEGA